VREGGRARCRGREGGREGEVPREGGREGRECGHHVACIHLWERERSRHERKGERLLNGKRVKSEKQKTDFEKTPKANQTK